MDRGPGLGRAGGRRRDGSRGRTRLVLRTAGSRLRRRNRAAMHASMLDSLPPPRAGDDFARIRAIVGAGGAKVVVIDDDPTGTQTVHGVDILADWSVPSLIAALSGPRPCFYILANTR